MSYNGMTRASEISEYVYCRKLWWLRQVGAIEVNDSGRFVAGIDYHIDHQSRLIRAQRRRRAALVLLFLAVSILLFWVVRLL